MMKTGYSLKHILVVAFALSFSSAATSQEVNKEQLQNTEQEQVEQIEVLGKKPLLYYRRQMEQLELDFYDSINDLIENPDYRVTCRMETAGSGQVTRIKHKRCLPNYVRNRLALETQEAFEDGKPIPTIDDVEFLLKEEKEQALAAVAEVVEKNPELLKQLIKMNDAQTLYKQKRDEAFGSE